MLKLMKKDVLVDHQNPKKHYQFSKFLLIVIILFFTDIN
jgi:hypothetical protein